MAQSKAFNLSVNIALIVNGVSGALIWTRQPQAMTFTVELMQDIVQVLFIYEMVVKLIAYGLRYFRDPWNLFDFLITNIAGALMLYDLIAVGFGENSLAKIVRSLRFIRLIVLMKRIQSLRIIFNTFILSLPSMANILGLLIITMSFYAVIGMNMFSYVRLQDSLDSYANFQNFFTAMFTLLRMSTGENWNWLMVDMGRGMQPNFVCYNYDFVYENLVKYGVNGCGSKWGAVLYCISFQFLYKMIVLNLFIAVILKVFEEEYIDMNKSSLSFSDIQQLKDVWLEFDPEATALIKAVEFEQFLDKLQPPLKWTSMLQPDQTNLHDFVKSLDLHIYHQKNSKSSQNEFNSIENIGASDTVEDQSIAAENAYYYFHEVLLALSKRALERKSTNFL